jgi:phosphatidylserine/phosphatidylglycerophosphate/cardiolipin synthase-like enzyme
MASDLESLAQVIQQLAATTPAESVAQLVSELSTIGSGDWANARNRIAGKVSNSGLRRRVENLINVWQSFAPQMGGTAVALALLAAFEATKLHRAEQSIDLVWTGPDSRMIPLRRTDQALLQVVNSATTRLLVVSFAVYKVSAIAQALIRAAQRQVSISICIESPDASEGKITYDAVRAFGNEVPQHARFYVWPLDKRPKSPDGKHGSLHSKLAVADGKTLLISSANLTEYAMNLNMELGVLVQGGNLPGQVERHFEQLMELKVFEPIGLR